MPSERGPEPRPDWVVTSASAIDTELGVLKTGKEADVFLIERAVPGSTAATTRSLSRSASAPCTAAIGVTGDIKCFNSIATCQDSANFNDVPATLRFAEASDYRPLDIDANPSIQSVSFTPARIVVASATDLHARSGRPPAETTRESGCRSP